MIDLLVAGGGPAGLGTAIHAALAGMEAVVIEPRATPVDKACGEGIMPGGVRALDALGVDVAGGLPLRGIRYVDGRRRAEAPFRAASGLGMRRTALHAALSWRAAELGVKVLTGKVGEVRQSEDGVSAAGVRARWLIAADGLHSPIRGALGLDARCARPRRYGLRRHYRVRPWTDFVEVHWPGGGAPSRAGTRCLPSPGEVYVTPVGPECVGVAVLSAERRGFDAHLAAFPALAPLLDGAPAGAVRGAGPLRQRVARRTVGRVLLVGDAAGYVDALTGEGIALALASADAAVRCLKAGRPQAYEAEWRRLTRRHRLLTEGLLRVGGSAAGARLIVPLAAGMPAVFRAAVHALQ
ncbi:NAD(P)/FAD-dependent oxidoreductase [Streptomyces piniterrae]|uniref:NAD(P)/FAD-dependent oxidoreductase n=1 Tax=Streptomyces piniterrae TaxID=2571125 RepID=A0A4U0NWC1_9ACTN|nr:NAD(P)/FAD-dependent oxidoreductase [Streptomyces piniterrae]TJZ58920.1 NAD(P)/FAD-dependent oxidoreductase [Streptomyces piniterrae]